MLIVANRGSIVNALVSTQIVIWYMLTRDGPGTDSFLLRHWNGACVFLERIEARKLTRCLIHSFKPSACREWTPSLYRRDCQEGLIKYWGLTVSPSGQFEGSQQKLPEFYSFLESLAPTTNGTIDRVGQPADLESRRRTGKKLRRFPRIKVGGGHNQ